jgi:hypothetical protein
VSGITLSADGTVEIWFAADDMFTDHGVCVELDSGGCPVAPISRDRIRHPPSYSSFASTRVNFPFVSETSVPLRNVKSPN